MQQHFELAYLLNVQNHRQEEINTRLLSLLDRVKDMVPEEVIYTMIISVLSLSLKDCFLSRFT